MSDTEKEPKPSRPEKAGNEGKGEPRSAEGETRVGVYVCHCGGNISDVVDVQRVAEEAAKLPGVVVSQTDVFMCSDPGQNRIIEDVKKYNLNRVVVASCSPRLHELTFRKTLERAGLNPFLYEQANIREQVSWVHPNKEEATRKAFALVSAAVAKARKLEPLEHVKVEARPRAVVIGGGVAGLKAARDLSKRGILVTLVEKTAFLGGRTALLDKVFPSEENAADIIRELADPVLDDPNITLHTCAEVTGAEGYVGNFTLSVRQSPEGVTSGPDEATGRPLGKPPVRRYQPFEGYRLSPAEGEPKREGERTFTIQAGAIVIATGFQHYTPAKKEYGYQRYPEVVTLPDFIRMLAEAEPSRGPFRLDGREVRSVAFIHCVGSRQVPGVNPPQPDGKVNEYCSRVCCTATLQTANELREKFPDVAIYDFYQDIRTYGRGHEDYYEKASKNGVIFFRYDPKEPPKVSKAKKGDGGALLVSVKDGLTWGEEVEVAADLVVLSVGMMPSDIKDLVDYLKIPVGADRFLLEVHPKLRPVELAVNGVVLAGACQAPKDITEACASASAAAVKVAGLLTRGYVELEPFVARVDPDRCEGHGLCAQECAYEGAITFHEGEKDGRKIKQARVNPAVCVGCGACVAVCPTRAIDINGWTLDQFEAMVDAIVAAE